jgi:vacuolar protein sorting-associated protein 33A
VHCLFICLCSGSLNAREWFGNYASSFRCMNHFKDCIHHCYFNSKRQEQLLRITDGIYIDIVADQIKRVRRDSSITHEFSIFWVPRRTLVSNQILEECGVLGEANISELPLLFVPLAEDVLSLELDDAFSDLYLHRDPTSVFLSAKALMLMQQKHGLFPRITGKGDNAKKITDLLIRMRSELTAGEEDSPADGPLVFGLTPSSQIESLIIIDREVDLLSVLMTQLTYEGLIDELFTISANQTDVDSSIVGTAPSAPPGSTSAASSTAPPPGTKRKVQLDQKDTLYSTLVDANFAVVGPLLNKSARRLQATYDSRPNIGTKTTAELREFVAKLPGYQSEQASLKLHTSLAEDIMKHTRSDIFSRVLEVQQNLAAGADPASQSENIDELISRSVSLPIILRLICIYSAVSGGLRSKDHENFKRAILHAYGHQHLLTLSRLESMGLVYLRPGIALPGTGGNAAAHTQKGTAAIQTNYASARKSLRLIVDEVNESSPDDTSYVYSGYAPLSVRIVQCVLQKQYILHMTGKSNPANANLTATTGFRPFEDALRYVRGPNVDEMQRGEERAAKAKGLLNGSGSGGEGNGNEKTVVVFFVGGICRAEIAALRFVGQKMKEAGIGRRILIATTGVVKGDGIVGSAIEKGRFGE